MLYFGIDPGLTACGVGGVRNVGGSLKHVFHFTIRPKAATTQGKLDEVCCFVRRCMSEGGGPRGERVFVAIEMPFWFPKTRNGKTLILQAMTVGAIITALRPMLGEELFEVHPNTVKRAVTGWGGGGFGKGRKEAPTKRQVQLAVRDILKLEKSPPQDAADALAVAIWLSGEVRTNMRVAAR